MNDIRWRIIETLISAKKPVRCSEIAKNLHKPQNHVDYHLRALVDDGLVLCFEEDSSKLYSVQKYLKSTKIENDLKEVFIVSIPRAREYFDFSQCKNPTLAYMNCVSMLMMKMRSSVESEIKDVINL